MRSLLFSAGFIASVAIGAMGAGLAVSRYPIPFDPAPDWVGASSEYPKTPEALLLVTYGLRHNIVLVHTSSKAALNDESAARLAYNLIYVDHAETKWPSNGVYVVIGIFEQPDVRGEMRMWGYVFERDTEGLWKPRHVGRDELEKIESIVLHGPTR